MVVQKVAEKEWDGGIKMIEPMPAASDTRRRDSAGHYLKEHGYTGTSIHRIWKSMKARCACPGQSSYRWYGARGIVVCSGWEKFDNFREWAENSGYHEGLSIDRIDPNGSYCPENCRWVPLQFQPTNRRNCRYITVDGVTCTQGEWARRIGVHHTAIIGARNAGKDVEAYIKQRMERRSRT